MLIIVGKNYYFITVIASCGMLKTGLEPCPDLT